MGQAKSIPKLTIVSFCIAVFFLTSVGLAVFQRTALSLQFWFTFVYVGAWSLVIAFGVDSLNVKGNLSGRKVFVLTLGVMLTSTLFTYSAWAIISPKWSFSVSTDKATYRPGEDVRITTALKNMGFISHSFWSASNSPVIISIESQYLRQFWYSAISRNVTGFVVGPAETLERSFVWNQTDIYHPEEKIRQGTYWISAFIPKESSETLGFDNLFSTWTSINITSI